MEEAGYVDIVETKFAWPLGPWVKGEKIKTLGIWGKENFLSVIQGLSMAVMTRGLKMTPVEVEVLLASVRKEVMGRKIHCYAPM